MTKLCDLSGDSDLVTAVAWAERGTNLAVGTNKQQVQIWDIEKALKIRTLFGHENRVGCLAWNGDTIASGSRDRMILHRDIRVDVDFERFLYTLGLGPPQVEPKVPSGEPKAPSRKPKAPSSRAPSAILNLH